MAAINEETLGKIKNLQNEVEPLLVDMIKNTEVFNCPFRIMKESDVNSPEMRNAVKNVAIVLAKGNIPGKMNLPLNEPSSYDALVYAVGYWGGRTLNKYGNQICKCTNKCY